MKALRNPRRLLLWSLPPGLLAAAVFAWSCAEETSILAEVSDLLVRGEAEAAGERLARLADSPTLGARARAGLRLAEILGGETGTPVANGAPLDLSPFPLEVIARAAFERGEFQAAVRVTDLAAALDRPHVPVVRTAALIEDGRADLLRSVSLPAPPGGGRREGEATLAGRVESWLTDGRDDGSRLLRDRRGRPLGRLTPAGELVLADGVPPELVPRALAEIVPAETDAPSIRLSLDLELSALALEAFGRYHRGSVVIVEVATGEILAAVSDRLTSRREEGTPAFEQYREPASISKLLTTTASLRAGLDPDAEIRSMTCRGHGKYAGEFLYCPYIAGRLRGLDRAMAVSCNYAFAELGVRVGRRRMLEELRLYGFDVEGLGPFPAGRILAPEGDARQLADLAIGLEATAVTPLHAALLATVMANDGVMPSPTLIHAVDGRLGLHPQVPPRRAGRRVVESGWLPLVLGAMEEVAERGTAQRVAPANFPVAMKTGTASDPRWGFHVNYIGVGPMPEARLAFAVRITHQPTSKKVRYAARSVTSRLLRRLGRVAEERGWVEASPSGFLASRSRPERPTPAPRPEGFVTRRTR